MPLEKKKDVSKRKVRKVGTKLFSFIGNPISFRENQGRLIRKFFSYLTCLGYASFQFLFLFFDQTASFENVSFMHRRPGMRQCMEYLVWFLNGGYDYKLTKSIHIFGLL